METAVEDLKNEAIIRVEVKRTGRGSYLHATLAKNGLARDRVNVPVLRIQTLQKA